MGGAANSLAARRCTPLTLGVGLIYALCGMAGRARANGDCVESCRSKVLGASATGGAPGQVVCEIVPEESYAHCPADGSAPILDLDTGACWWASSAVPVGHRCCNLGVEPRCGLPPTPEPWQLWIVSPSPPCCETRQPSSHSAAAVPQAVGVVYCGITAWFAVSWRRRQRYLRSKRHDIDEDAKDVWPLLDGDGDSGADPERGEVEGSAEPSSCCGWCPCSRRHQPSTAYSSLGRDSSMIDDESSMPEPLPEPGPEPEPQPQPQPRPQREPEPEPKRRAPHRVSTGLSAEDKAARQVAAAEAARKRRQEKNLRRRGRGAAAPSPEPEEVAAAPATAAGTGRGPAARSSGGGERGGGERGGGEGGGEAGGGEAGACSNYRLDMSAAEFGACVCGYPKMEHEEFRAAKLASPTMRKARV